MKSTLIYLAYASALNLSESEPRKKFKFKMQEIEPYAKRYTKEDRKYLGFHGKKRNHK